MAENDRHPDHQLCGQGGHRLRCPICGKAFLLPVCQPRPKWFPFCSERCKWVDLAGWLDGHYKIITPITPDRTTGQQ